MPEMKSLKLPGYSEAFEVVDAEARERLDGHDAAIQNLQGSIPDTSGFVTRTVSDLENYYTKSKTYSRDEIDQRISAIPKFAISVVSSLPTSDISTTTVYLLSGGSDGDLYTEYIYVDGAWEILGSQRVDLTGYATRTWTLEQLSIYALKSEIPSVPVQSVNGKTGAVQLTASDLGALTEDDLSGAVDDALAQAKASGEFDGPQGDKGDKGDTGETGPQGPQGDPGPAGADGSDGRRGTGILKITTSTTSASGTGSTGEAIKYKVSLSAVKSEAGVDEVLVGDTVLRSYYIYPVVMVDSSYVYLGAYTNIRGATGAQGPKGEDGEPGPAGADGATGPQGPKGEDGFSPTVAVTEIDGGHRLTIADINGTKTVDIMDGKDGKDGAGGSGEAETYETVVKCAPVASDGVEAYAFQEACIAKDGAISFYAEGYYVSKAYPIIDGCVVAYKGRGVTNHCIVAFYDADGAFISGISTTAGGLSTIEGTAEIPEGARMVMFGTNGTDAYGQITYTTSGEASIRETTYTPNGTGMTEPGYWNTSGVFEETASYHSTAQVETDADYITVTVLGRTYSSIGHVCFFNSNKALIEAKPLVQNAADLNGWYVAAPEGTRYYTVTLYDKSGSFAKVTEITVASSGSSGGSGGSGVNTAELAERLTAVEATVDELYAETVVKDYATIVNESVSSAIIGTDGAEAATGSFRASGFVAVNEACVIDYLLYGSTSTAMIAFYDEHQDFISGIVPTSSGLHTNGGVVPPDGAYFIRYAVITSSSGYDTQYVKIQRKRIDSLCIENARRKASDPLYGKILTATGDSITATVSNRPYAGYARMIAADHNMTYESKAIWGATIASGISGSSGCILDTLANMRADADYVILSGGANDFYHLASGSEQLGAITTGYAAALDTTTFCGAVESLCKTAINKWVGRKILYVITHRMLDVSEQTTSQAVSMLKQILEKWGIPYVDLWHGMPSLMFDSLKNLYTSNGNTVYDGVGDGLHPNEDGYRLYYVPRVEAKLKSI